MPPRLALLFLLLLPIAPGAENFARGVRIQRDRYGVPHISAPTDAGAAYGLMLAQAEDNFWQIEEDYIRILGRGAEIHGQRAVLGDLLYRAFEIERRAKEEYTRMDSGARAICDAFADGLNQYLATHPRVKPRLIGRFQPWQILAVQLSAGLGNAISAGRFTRDEIAAAFPEVKDLLVAPPVEPTSDDEGSNMWALAASRTTSGRAMLFINPHMGFFGGAQRYEAHLKSKQGLQVSGFAILGTPYIRSGWTRTHGWSHTNNYADTVDVWREPETAEFTSWTATLQVKTLEGMETRNVTLRKTKHGPVVAMRGGAAHTARVAGAEHGGTLEQRIAMARAHTIDEFKTALARRAFTGSNTMYADRAGNIYYVHGCLVPKRAVGVDPSKVLDGGDPNHEWQGYHALEELPQILNPPSGFLQNCNSTPFGAAGDPPLIKPAQYPAYVALEPDNLRAKNSRRLLSGAAKISFEQWSVMGLDTSVYAATEDLKRLPQSGPADLQPLFDVLHAWNRVSTVDSVAMTLYVRWAPLRIQDPLAALRQVKERLEGEHGTWKVPYGDVTRLQRVHTSGSQEEFSDAKPSLPVPGGPGTLGMLFVFNTRQPAGAKRAYGTGGNTYVAVVEFGKKPRGRSMLVFGQSADPASRHYFDQAELYSKKKFKDAK